MEKVFDIASKVSTPLGLAGIFAVIFFYILKQIIDKGQIRALSGSIIKEIVNKLFILALAAMLLGFMGFMVKIVRTPSEASTGYTLVLKGKVVNEAGAPIANSEIAIRGLPMTIPAFFSDSEGDFIKSIPSNSNSLNGIIVVKKEGYEKKTRNITLTPNANELEISMTRYVEKDQRTNPVGKKDPDQGLERGGIETARSDIVSANPAGTNCTTEVCREDGGCAYCTKLRVAIPRNAIIMAYRLYSAPVGQGEGQMAENKLGDNVQWAKFSGYRDYIEGQNKIVEVTFMNWSENQSRLIRMEVDWRL